MYRFHRTAMAKQSKLQEAFKFAKEMSEYLGTKYAPVKVQAYLEIFGDNGRIHWYSDYDDLASVEKITGKIRKDQGYWEILNKANDVFIEGSIQDTLMQAFQPQKKDS